MDKLIYFVVPVVLTAVVYMAFPLLRLILNKGKFESKRARRIALWNSIIVGGIFSILTTVLLDSGAHWNAFPAFMYYWINKVVLTNGRKDAQARHDRNEKMDFEEWKQLLTNTPDYPNDTESHLAFQTLKTCIVKNHIDDEGDSKYKITQNGYALFDYTMFCYFFARVSLCDKFPPSFVEKYDAYTQTLMSVYFDTFFDIPQETTSRLIIQRGKEYERLVAQNASDGAQQLLNTLVQYIEKDFEGTPEYEGVIVPSIFDHFELYKKVADYSSITLGLLYEHVDAATIPQSSPIPPKEESTQTNHISEQDAISKNESGSVHSNRKSQKTNLLATLLPAFFIVVALIIIIGILIAAKSESKKQEQTIQDLTNEIQNIQSDNERLRTECATILSSKDAEIKKIKANLDNKATELKETQTDLQKSNNDVVFWMAEAQFWMNEYVNSDPKNVSYSEQFLNVNQLLTAIANNPYLYDAKNVKVLGTIYRYNSIFEEGEQDTIFLFSGSENEIPSGGGVAASSWIKKKKEAKEIIEVRLSNDLQYSAAQTGDYVKMYGLVISSNDKIYLTLCEYY